MYRVTNGIFIEEPNFNEYECCKLKVLNCSNHTLTEKQIEDLEKTLTSDIEIVELSEELKKEWGQSNPYTYRVTVKSILNFCDEQKIEYIHLAGFMPAVYDMLKHGGYKHFFYSYTVRITEEKEVNGEIIKTSKFKHEGWFEYI